MMKENGRRKMEKEDILEKTSRGRWKKKNIRNKKGDGRR